MGERARRRWQIVAVGAVVLALLAPGGPAAGDVPNGVPDAYTSPGGGVLRVGAAEGLLANDGGAGRTAKRAARPAHGSVQVAPDGSFTYRAASGFEGLDGFTYRVVDGAAASDPIRVEVLVNRAPRTTDDRYSIPVDGRLRVAVPGISANDVDLVGAPVQTFLIEPAAHGRATVGVRGGVGYVPDPGFEGVDTFRYSARDAFGRWSRATTVRVRVGANRAPTAVTDALTVFEDDILEIAAPGLLGNDTDPDGDPLTAELVGFVDGGNVILEPNGAVLVEMPVDSDRDVIFRYRVGDGELWSAPVTVVVDVIAVNDPPLAEADQYEASVGATLEMPAPGVLANDSDPVEFDGLFARLDRGPTSGVLVLRRDGSFTYTPDPGPSRSDSFLYSACDVGGCSSSSVDLTITNDAEI